MSLLRFGLATMFCLALSATLATAQDSSPDFLAGSYAFDFTPESRDHGGNHFWDGFLNTMGVLELHEDGTLEGKRFLYRKKECPDLSGSDSSVEEILEQTLSGTWSVDEDGFGLASYSVDPAPIYRRDCTRAMIEHDPVEEIRFVAARGGCQMILRLQARVLRVDHEGNPLFNEEGERFFSTVDLAGSAERRDDRCVAPGAVFFAPRPAAPKFHQPGELGLR